MQHTRENKESFERLQFHFVLYARDFKIVWVLFSGDRRPEQPNTARLQRENKLQGSTCVLFMQNDIWVYIIHSVTSLEAPDHAIAV